MLEINKIRTNKEEIINRLNIRNFNYTDLIDQVLKFDEQRREIQFILDKELSELNQLSKSIGELFKSGEKEKANTLKLKTTKLKESTKILKEKLSFSEKKQKEILCQIPNVPNPLVPAGNSEKDNQIIEEIGKLPKLYNGAVPHWDLAKEYQLIDFELGVKISGAGFPVYTGVGAQLQRAMINFFFQLRKKNWGSENSLKNFGDKKIEIFFSTQNRDFSYEILTFQNFLPKI